MRLFIYLGMTLLFSACADITTNYYTQTIQSWRGGNASTLVERWGTPYSKVISPHGDTLYFYKTRSYYANAATTAPAVGVNFNSRGNPVIVSTPPTNNAFNRGNSSLTCTVIFIADRKGKIVNIQTQGYGCYGGQYFAKTKANPQ